jgi:hypothetical protein
MALFRSEPSSARKQKQQVYFKRSCSLITRSIGFVNKHHQAFNSVLGEGKICGMTKKCNDKNQNYKNSLPELQGGPIYWFKIFVRIEHYFKHL